MICSSLIEWWHAKPPVAVFVLTLIACALTLACLTIYVDFHKDDFPNPNKKDWNSLFSSLSKLELCIPDSVASVTSEPHTDLGITDEHKALLIKQANTSSVTALVSLDLFARAPGGDIMSVMHATLQQHILFVTVTEDLLGRKVQIGGKREVVAVTFGMPDLNPTPANKQPKSEVWKKPRPAYAGKQSDSEGAQACLTFVGPPHLLPDTKVAPPHCKQNKLPMARAVVSDGLDGPCSSNDTITSLYLRSQRHLTPLLSREETLLIRLHLVYTTCALVMLVVLLLFCAACRRCASRAAWQKGEQFQGQGGETYDCSAVDVQKQALLKHSSFNACL